MKRRSICLFLVLLLLATSLSGCGQDSKEESKVTENVISYKYDRKLNVIDDNYRNYYEIFVGSFYDSDGDGMGDLKGVAEKLDYVEYMGFNGIWLMPIMPSTTYHKYDVTNYMDIASQYGTLEDFKLLVEECHKRDIRLVLDLVINHSSSKHEWFKEACKYLGTLADGQEPDETVCPYVNYYYFSREKKNDTYYAVSGATGWYYEGSFWSEMPDLNLENPKVRAEFEAVADFWLDLGVDGFRMDAALHFVENQPEVNKEILNWLYTYCTAKNPDFYMVSEVWGTNAVSTNAEYYGSKTPSMFNFDTASSNGIIVKAVRGALDAGSVVDRMIYYQQRFGEQNPDYIDAPFLSNHDQVRISNTLASNEEQLKMAAGILLTMNGSPFVYYGEEIGMPSKSTKDENKRIAMFWSATDTTGMTKGPANADKDIVSNFEAVDEQLADGYSLLNYYRRALRLRNENPEIARGTIEKIEELCSGKQAVITKTYDGSTIAIVYNLGEEEISINIAGSEIDGMKIRGYLTLIGEEVTLKDGVLTMPKRAICILK